MANNKKGNLWILISLCVACIIMSTVVYVALYAKTHDYFVAIISALGVALFACVCVWQIFTQLENMVPKSERERIKAEKQAEEERKKQLAEEPGQEHAPDHEEEAIPVEPCDAQATYFAGVQYHDKMQAACAKKKLVTIEEYVRFIMAPFVESKDMDYLWTGIRAFVESPLCEVTPFTRFKIQLGTYDVKHLIWNIACRLGYGKGQPYNSVNCAKFIRAFFPTICQYNNAPMDISSLQNLTLTSTKEKLHLDYPDPDKFGFHIPGQLGLPTE